MPNKLLENIILFLEGEFANSTDERERKNREKVIEYFKNSKGQCYGLAVLQAYGKKIEDENSSKTEPSKPADDLNFFRSTKELLLSWNGVDPLSQNNHLDIERLISNILFYQRSDVEMRNFSDIIITDSIAQDFAEIFEDTSGRKFVKRYQSEEAILPKKALQTRLEEIVKKGAIVIVGSGDRSKNQGHANAIYQSNDEEIYFFNNEEERVVKNFADLADCLWSATDPKNFRNPMQGSMISDFFLRENLSFQSYQLKDEKEYNDYPDKITLKLDEFKEFVLTDCENFELYVKRGNLFESMLDLITAKDAKKIYDDPEIKSPELKTMILSKAFGREPFFGKRDEILGKVSRSIIALPPIVMTKEMLRERLEKLDRKEIGSITITHEIDGEYNCASITRYENDENPLHLTMQTGEDFPTMSLVTDRLWELSEPSKYRAMGGVYPAEMFLRRVGIYVFEKNKNRDAQNFFENSTFLQPKLEELQQLYKQISENHPFLKRSTLASDFLNQFATIQTKKSEENEIKEQIPVPVIKTTTTYQVSGKNKSSAEISNS